MRQRRILHSDKGFIQEEDRTFANICAHIHAPNIEEPQYIRQMLTTIKGKIDRNTIKVGGF